MCEVTVERGSNMSEQLGRAESAAIERHRKALSAQWNRDVTPNEALADWLKNYAVKWREQRHARMLALQREEILRYKWIESEKHNHDVGAAAVFDWINRYAAIWRVWFEQEYEDKETEQQTPASDAH